ncbi:hypothetical protein A1O7_07938 [Cladophialophora yegresii CBS 114405]|uniref:Uncharacterized protein n=1 Tax=Cladophialophora yegresii CBS 114405 TaxID=1182544 RepID=W9VXZ9_9EURO|nr:uncharacterized protein A1O7_07938 [Cladophialophora yegresii CBS 114405]EXJ57590.1 hypothetical protein A1O7_07938 [Cladophialophora yegresii CBS 114405]
MCEHDVQVVCFLDETPRCRSPLRIKAGSDWPSARLYYELADFSFEFCKIEPCYFRSNFLNPSSVLKSQDMIPDYEAAAIRKDEQSMEQTANEQPRDINKGFKVIVVVIVDALPG